MSISRRVFLAATTFIIVSDVWSMKHAEIDREFRPAVVFIKVEYSDSNGKPLASTGSGFVVNEAGYVLTAAHVVPPAAVGSPEFKARCVAARKRQREHSVPESSLGFSPNPPPFLG